MISKSKINERELEQVSEIKFLGVTLDCKLTWSSHIQRIRNKIAKSEDIICQAKKFFRMKHLLHFIRHLFNTSYILHKILSKCKEAKKKNSLCLVDLQKFYHKLYSETKLQNYAKTMNFSDNFMH